MGVYEHVSQRIADQYKIFFVLICFFIAQKLKDNHEKEAHGMKKKMWISITLFALMGSSVLSGCGTNATVQTSGAVDASVVVQTSDDAGAKKVAEKESESSKVQPDAESLQDSARNSALETADSVWKNGKIHTVDANNLIVEAIAVKDGKILFTGSDADVEAYIGEETNVTDLEGKTVIPGLIDAHTHAPGTLMSEMYAIPVPNTSDLDEVLRVVRSLWTAIRRWTLILDAVIPVPWEIAPEDQRRSGWMK